MKGRETEQVKGHSLEGESTSDTQYCAGSLQNQDGELREGFSEIKLKLTLEGGIGVYEGKNKQTNKHYNHLPLIPPLFYILTFLTVSLLILVYHECSSSSTSTPLSLTYSSEPIWNAPLPYNFPCLSPEVQVTPKEVLSPSMSPPTALSIHVCHSLHHMLCLLHWTINLDSVTLLFRLATERESWETAGPW